MVQRLDLHEVAQSGASDGQVPVWNASAGEWEPQTATDPSLTLYDAKGDLLVGTANDARARLAGGSDGQVLTFDSTQSTGVKWATPAAGGSLTVQDENSNVSTGVTQIDFQGAGVIASAGAGEVIVTIPGTSGATAETYDNAVTAALTGIVHRWKFDDASGATVTDSVGSLNLTLAGTFTRHVASPTGFGTTFGASAVADSSGLGSIPVGGNSRCFIILYRTNTNTVQQTLVGYGPTGSTRQWWDGQHRSVDCPGLAVWSDDLNPNVWVPSTYAQIESPSGRGNWHLAAFGYNSGSLETFAYRDGSLFRRILGGALNTGSSGNFRVGLDTSSANRFGGDIDDIIVMNNMPTKQTLDRLLCAAAGIPHLH